VAKAKEPCSVCTKAAVLEWICVRVYRRRSQTEFRYHVCPECKQILATFLEGGAVSVQRGLFYDLTTNKMVPTGAPRRSNY
jgi:hypothetical protein